jgi:16S rRNA (cytosine1402-N4)-methyltransferase
MTHQPVLLEEVLQYLKPAPGGAYLDCTVGEGGHAEAILEGSGPDGRLLGLDRDPGALARAGARLEHFGGRVVLLHGSFADIPKHLQAKGWSRVHGMVADLGLCSRQLADPDRGFAFSMEGPLDMRFDPSADRTAADLVNHMGEKELADLLYQYGEERKSRAIARRIVARRPLLTTSDLRGVVYSAIGGRRRGGIDPATRTFQALRIAVNQETRALEALLAEACHHLEPEGRLAIISYHSLEDRAVKWAFRGHAGADATSPYRILTKKPIRPSPSEIDRNRRARSAKLRVLERVA